MGRSKRRRKVTTRNSGIGKQLPVIEPGEVSPGAEKYFEIFVLVVLLLFGAYQSILYFGHQVAPNSDFPAFVGVAKPLLSFDLPGTFKRVPVLGLLQIGLSKFVSGQYPELTAGWLLNAILHPLNLVLLYLVGRKVLGRSAVWFAVIAIINPWTLAMLVQPIVETTLIFFTLLSFFFMLRRSGWCYVFASITSMVRYEGAVLILAAFVLDVIECENWKQRGITFVKAAVASIPISLWMLLTLTRQDVGKGSGHYLAHYGRDTVLAEYIALLWQVTFSPLFSTTSKSSLDVVSAIGKVVAGVGILCGFVFGILSRKRQIWSLLLFFVPYFLIHTLKSNTRDRYCIPIAWLTLLLCLYGFKCLWELLSGKLKIPRVAIIILQVVMLIVAVSWAAGLVSFLPKLAPYSERSVSVPYVAMAVAMLLAAGYGILFKTRGLMTYVTTAGVICLIAISNQFRLAPIMSNGDMDIEFKLLADWYVTEAKNGEKLVTTLPHVVRIFAPKYRGGFVPTERIKGDGPVGFMQGCYDNNITYVAWDSRLGMTPQNSYYKKYGLDRIAMLGRGKSVGGYEFIKQIRPNNRRYINIYRLRRRRLPQGNNGDNTSLQ